jgi:YHS domain-containing protein
MFSFLARLILFAIAISVIRSVVSFVQRAFSGSRSASQPPPVVRGPGGSPGTATTMLQQDPVCGTYVAVDSSLKRVVNGRVLHFCSAECRDKYSS